MQYWKAGNGPGDEASPTLWQVHLIEYTVYRVIQIMLNYTHTLLGTHTEHEVNTKYTGVQMIMSLQF